MRHQRKGRKLHREKDQRNALLKGLAVNLIMHGKIRTTTAKAKEMRPLVERLVTYAKKNTATGFRQISRILPKVATRKLYREYMPRYSDRNGGYIRIIRTLKRAKDRASMSVIEFV